MSYFSYNISSIITRIGSIIAPPRCNGCSILLMARAIFCEQCAATISPVLSASIPLTVRHEMNVFAAGAYQGPLKKLILAKHGSRQLAGSYLGEIVGHCTPFSSLPCDYVIPVPLHWTRRMSRGFNQADEMVQALSRMSGIPVAHVLKRTKRTDFQASLSAVERSHNVADAFAVTTHDVSRYYGKHLVLVDDLMTTGVTLKMAGRELLKLKPASLTCFVAARTI